jgi:DNA invertase Pin-like site-specific DNA recombinase
MPIWIIPTNSIRTILAYWLKCTCSCQSRVQELQLLGGGFISLSAALALTTPVGRAMAGLWAICAEFERELLRERVKAGMAHARRRGTRHGRPPMVGHDVEEVQRLAAAGRSKAAMAKRVGLRRASVRRCLEGAMRLLSSRGIVLPSKLLIVLWDQPRAKNIR